MSADASMSRAYRLFRTMGLRHMFVCAPQQKVSAPLALTAPRHMFSRPRPIVKDASVIHDPQFSCKPMTPRCLPCHCEAPTGRPGDGCLVQLRRFVRRCAKAAAASTVANCCLHIS